MGPGARRTECGEQGAEPHFCEGKKEDEGLLGQRVPRGSKAEAAEGAAWRAGTHPEDPQLCLWLWVRGRGRTGILEATDSKRQRAGDGVVKVAPWCP